MRERVTELVREAIAEVNADSPPENRISADESTVLLGDDSPLDSLALVHLLVTLEPKLGTAFGAEIRLIGEQLMDKRGRSFLKTVGTLIDHISSRLQPNQG